MTYRVHFTNSAAEDAETAYQWIRGRSPSAAVKWFNGLADLVESLETFPERGSVAPETKEIGEEIRQRLYGTQPHTYRILFIIRRPAVYVIHIRHGARQTMKENEIQLP